MGIPVNKTNAAEPALEELVAEARQVAQHSYSPYSKFRVGAALRLASGEVVTGTNVENASYGLTICAERSALVRAVAVANLNGAASPPCGACRQMLAEFVLPDAPVAFPAEDGVRVMPFHDVLPMAFAMKLK
jgi:cytidine deaminase